MKEHIETETKDARTEVWVRMASGGGMYLGSVVFNGFRFVANVQDVVHFDDFDTKVMAIQAVATRCGFRGLEAVEVRR